MDIVEKKKMIIWIIVLAAIPLILFGKFIFDKPVLTVSGDNTNLNIQLTCIQ